MKGQFVQTGPNKGSAATILVVDDDALITLNMVDHLTELGHIVLEAYSGRDALTLLENHPEIAALITDYSMPMMNGVELAEQACRLRPGLPVLLSTGYAELPQGIANTLPRIEKPFREEELAEKVGALLSMVAPAE
ncbi:response regulator [Devosia faecipullorum]|uniref:response regulator n=1 Tax=Devosia faecipullorum TaxID=2755039 RepID=UPI00187B8C37|nr:response regulator [Devosia faecipullorum]MBE7734056.1 response regulator [Devosia faecipullorum]